MGDSRPLKSVVSSTWLMWEFKFSWIVLNGVGLSGNIAHSFLNVALLLTVKTHLSQLKCIKLLSGVFRKIFSAKYKISNLSNHILVKRIN